MHEHSESWVWIRGYEGLYQISDHGHVRSYWNGRHGQRPDPRLLIPSKMKRGGYFVVTLCDAKGNQKRVKIHHLVLEAFVGPRPHGMVARHLDDDPERNTVANLRWGTYAENIADQRNNTGLGAVVRSYAHGEACSWAKLTLANVNEIRARYHAGGVTQQELADEYRVSRAHIANLVRPAGRPWRHHGK